MLAVLLVAVPLLQSAFAALPYLSTTALTSTNNDSLVYIFQPSSDSTSASLLTIEAASSITPNSPATTITSSLPFLNGTNSAFIPFVDNNGDLYAFAGQCASGTVNDSLWSLRLDVKQDKKSWVRIDVSSASFNTDNQANAGGVNFLSSGFAFSSPQNNTPVLYAFGGMCPNGSIAGLTAENWQSSGNYSNTLLSLTPQGRLKSSSFASIANKDDLFELAPVASSRGPPIAEAGFSITSLAPLVDGPNQTNIQQNIVLIGGHTADAFINMSQVAMMSLPEESWSFVPVLNGQNTGSNELVRRNNLLVEPRSGHTAVLSEDGSRIIVLGGWVGDITTPAEPQLAILEVGEGFGGKGAWKWTLPTTTGTSYPKNGIYGHGAVVLPGNIMMITGGNLLSGTGSKSKRSRNIKRDAMEIHFYNISSNKWSTSYQNPSAETASAPSEGLESQRLHSGQKIRIGVGLGVGIPLFFLILTAALCLRRRKSKKDKRRSDLINQSLRGSGIISSQTRDSMTDLPCYISEKETEDTRYTGGRKGFHNRQKSDGPEGGWRNKRSAEAERTGLLVEIPSPTRGLRRGHARMNSHNTGESSISPCQIPAIAEADEEDVTASKPSDSPFQLPELDLGRDFTGIRSPPPKSPSPCPPRNAKVQSLSDPFSDPVPNPEQNPFSSGLSSTSQTPNENPEREEKGWIEDWEAVQARIQARREEQSISNLPSSSHVLSDNQLQHRVSPISQSGSKVHSDRTESNISDKSMHSAVSFFTNRTGKSSNQSINRNPSQRSSNLFSVLPAKINRKPIKSTRPARTSLPQAGAFSNAVSALQGTPPGQQQNSTAVNSRSIALNPLHSAGPASQSRMPSFGTLQAESHALLGNPRSNAAPPTSFAQIIGHEDYKVEMGDIHDDGDEDEFPQRPAQRRGRGLVGSMRNVLAGQKRGRLNTAIPSISSMGSPTTATVSSGSPTRASTATPFSMLNAHGPEYQLRQSTGIEYPYAAEISDSKFAKSRRTASTGSAPWRRRRSGAKDWDWAEKDKLCPPDEAQMLAPSLQGKTLSNSSKENRRQWRRSSPGVVASSSMRDDTSRYGSEAGVDWDVESAVERRCVQVMFTVPRERLRVVNTADGEVLGEEMSVRTRSVRSHKSATAVMDDRMGGNFEDDDDENEDTLGFERYYRRQAAASRDQLKPEDLHDVRGRLSGYASEGEAITFSRRSSRLKPGRGSPGLW